MHIISLPTFNAEIVCIYMCVPRRFRSFLNIVFVFEILHKSIISCNFVPNRHISEKYLNRPNHGKFDQDKNKKATKDKTGMKLQRKLKTKQHI